MIVIGYHGTNTDIEAWDLNHLGANQGQDHFPGIFFSDYYDDALKWAELAVKKSGGEPKVFIAECELNKVLDARKRVKLFDSMGETIRFCHRYFPDWFSSDGELPSYQYGYVEDKFSTYNGQYDLIKRAANENNLPLTDVCQALGFDSYIDYGEFAVTSPQQILSFMPVDHQLSDEEIDGDKTDSIPAEESFGDNFSGTTSLAAFETKASDYIRAARRGKPYKTKPGNRFTRRVYIKTNGGNNIWFDIDMNRLFKKQSFAVKIPIVGETAQYVCIISFEEWLPKLRDDIQKTGFNQLTVKRSLAEMMRFTDLKVRCSCPDFRFRQAAWLTFHNEIEGDPETRPSKITNPHDDLGKICKHLAFAINNKSIYFDKVSRIIYNYFINLKKSQKVLFDKIVAPKLGLDQLDESLGGTKKPEPEVPEEPVKQEPEQSQGQANAEDQQNTEEDNPEGGNQE